MNVTLFTTLIFFQFPLKCINLFFSYKTFYKGYQKFTLVLLALDLGHIYVLINMVHLYRYI